MTAVSIRASFYPHDCRNDRVRKNDLGSIFIATSFRDNLPSPGEDCLVLFTMAAYVYRNAGRHATHWIRQGNSYGFGAGFLFCVIYIVQNLFHQGKGSRSISLNSHYLVLFKNPRDKLQILTLAKQMYPGQNDFFLNQYEETVKGPFGYLLPIFGTMKKLRDTFSCKTDTWLLKNK